MTSTENRIELTPNSPKRTDWFSTGSKVFFGLALIPPALMFLIGFGGDAKWALAVDDNFSLLACFTVLLSTVSGCLRVAHKFASTK